jgi:hypothetical protein
VRESKGRRPTDQSEVAPSQSHPMSETHPSHISPYASLIIFLCLSKINREGSFIDQKKLIILYSKMFTSTEIFMYVFYNWC